MANFPNYPYSVILNVPNNKYAAEQLPDMPLYKKENRSETIRGLIDQSIEKLKNLSEEQRNLFILAQKEAPETVKQILNGRVTILNEEGEVQSIITILDQVKKIDENTIASMDQYKKKMDQFMKEVYELIETNIKRKNLTPENLENILNDLLRKYQTKDSLMAGITNQALTALKNAPNKTIQLFRQIPKEKIELYKRKGVSIQKILEQMAKTQTLTIKELTEEIKQNEETRKKFLAELIKIIRNNTKNNFVAIDKLSDEELITAITQKLFQDEANFFQSSIAIKMEKPNKNKWQQRQYGSHKVGSDAIEIFCSFGNPLIDPKEIEDGAVQLFQTGKLATRKTARLTFQNLSKKIDEGETGLDVFLKDLSMQKNPTLEITTTFRADKPDDVVSFLTKENTRFNFQFSDKLIQKNSGKFDRGGLKDISIEGGTLFSTIQMLNNYGDIPNTNELIFTLLNMSSVSALKDDTTTPDLKKFIQMILVSYIYIYAFNPQAEQIHNEVANIVFSKENTVYFHHVDTGIIPSYILLEQTIEQLNVMKQDLESLATTDEFVKVLIQPSNSFSGQENNLLKWAYKTSDPWSTISNLISYDTVVDIALNLFALGY